MRSETALLAAQWIEPTFWLYAGFVALVVGLLAVDLGLLHRRAHEISMREALGWTALWVGLALAFNVAVYFIYEGHWLGIGREVAQLDGTERAVHGLEAAKLFLTGYLVEKSLSMDNVFVIAMIFSYLAVPLKYQHRVLFWGILTALVLRGVMIAAGAALIQRFDWFVYVFGGFLVLTAVKMAVTRESFHPERSRVVWLIRRLLPVSSGYDGQRFFSRRTAQFAGRWAATPLLLALVMVETADVLFAVDSIPAIFAITADPFIVFTSNVFAILGLRALYFCLAAAVDKFRYLKASLVVVLGYVGVKMLLVHTAFKPDTLTSLIVVLSVLGAGALLSWLRPGKSEPVTTAGVAPSVPAEG